MSVAGRNITSFAGNAKGAASRASVPPLFTAHTIYRKGEQDNDRLSEQHSRKAGNHQGKRDYPRKRCAGCGIPFGKVTLLQGDPGDGKSKLMLSLAALLSKGAPLPFADEDESGEPMTVIYQTTEDDADDTVVPRFNSAGGDGDRLIFIKEDEKSLTIHADLCYLYGTYLEDYLHDVEICQQFAQRSRERMAEIILEKTGMTALYSFHTIHNYIDTKEMILRKGSIAAHDGELVLIPINMRDGSVLARGKGNPEWNYSAPHGAGRLMSRTKARETLDLEAYRKTMEGIYTTSVNEATIDEAPMAYKSLEDIIDIIRESVDVIEILKPIYNFKASE